MWETFCVVKNILNAKLKIGMFNLILEYSKFKNYYLYNLSSYKYKYVDEIYVFSKDKIFLRIEEDLGF